jgi:hypothetical protein
MLGSAASTIAVAAILEKAEYGMGLLSWRMAPY